MPALLPLIPAVRDYPGWQAELCALGAEHLARALLPPAQLDDPPEFRVLDGLWYPVRGHRWRRVDHGYLAELSADWQVAPDPRRTAALALLGRADAELSRDPMALRRLTLYQLAELLRADGIRNSGMPARLGVHPAEAAELAAAVRVRPVVDRAAAEGLRDAWRERRMETVGQLLDRLPHAGGDQLLDAVRRRFGADRAERDRLLSEAGTLAGRGEFDQAVRCSLRASRLASDDQRPVAELIRIGALAARLPGAHPVGAEPVADGVRLSWQPAARPPGDGTGLRYRVLRGQARRPGLLVEVGTVECPELLDTTPQVGATVRYAVLPVVEARLVGGARLSPPVDVAPPPGALRLTPGRRSVALAWDAPGGAVAVRVVRTPQGRAAGAPREFTAGSGGWMDDGLEPGSYTYAVSCGYRRPDGGQVWSAPVSDSTMVEEYPDPVESVRLTRLATDSVRVDWPVPAHGWSQLVEWGAGPLPDPGAELPSDLTRGLSAAAPTLAEDGRAHVDLVPVPGSSGRYLLITTLGRRAVAGPGVLIDVFGTVADLRTERSSDGCLRLTFSWPDPAVQVEVGWRQGDEWQRRALARSSYLRDGLVLPTDDRACELTVTPVGRAGADLMLGGTALLRLPPFLRIAWTVDRPRMPGMRSRRPWRVGITVLSPREPDGVAWPLPDFLLVAAEGRVRPLRPEQGWELLRVPGSRLAGSGPLRVEIQPLGLSGPAVLRAFLVGPEAGAAQLLDPDFDTLVVH